MPRNSVLIVMASAVVLAGCSSRPRSFAPVLAAAPPDQPAYEAKLQNCRERLAARMDRSGRLASAAAGTAVGVGAGYAAGAATAAGTAGTIGAAGAAAAAAVMVLPIAGLAGAWGVSKIKKNKKEKAIKNAMAECLAEGGYSVDQWRVMSKREVRASLPQLLTVVPSGRMCLRPIRPTRRIPAPTDPIVGDALLDAVAADAAFTPALAQVASAGGWAPGFTVALDAFSAEAFVLHQDALPHA